MQTAEPLKLSLHFQCLTRTHCVPQISRKPAASLVPTQECLLCMQCAAGWHIPAPDGWDIACPSVRTSGRHWDRWSVWIQWVQMQLTYSICTGVQEKAVCVAWSECLDPDLGAPPHHWDGQVKVDSLIPAPCWANAHHTAQAERWGGGMHAAGWD